MSINLIESEHRTQRSLGGTLVSIAMHACLISLAVYATATAVEPRQTYEHAIDIWPPSTPTKIAHAPTHPTHPVAARDPHPAPVSPHAPISILTSIPTTLPPIDVMYPVINDSTLFGSAPRADSSGAPGG